MLHERISFTAGYGRKQEPHDGVSLNQGFDIGKERRARQPQAPAALFDGRHLKRRGVGNGLSVLLRQAVQDAVRCPSPASLAALAEWPHAWVAEEEAVYGVPGDRRKRSLVDETGGARQSPDLVAAPESAAAARTRQSDGRVWSF